jgi:choice-of-anchor C domain-containing protein
MSKRWARAILAAIAAFQLKSVSAELIVNGGFEDPKVPSIGFETYNGGGAGVFGWTVATGDIDLVDKAYYSSASGLQSLDLNGYGRGEIFQNVTTAVGENYWLTLSFAGNPVPRIGSGPGVKKMEVRWGNQIVATLTHDISGYNATNVGWRSFSFSVTGHGVDHLSFRSLTDGNAGPAIDHVSLLSQESSPTLISFEGLLGMPFMPQSVPEKSRLSNQFALALGITFSSAESSVAVVNLGQGHATSGTNGIGAIRSGSLNYSAPLTFTFSFPGYPEIPATTDFVSVRGDQLGGGTPLRMSAFDLGGALIASTNVSDRGGALLSIAVPGIHKVMINGNGSTAFDDISFNQLIAAREIITFEDLSGIDFVVGTPIPPKSRLTGQYAHRGVIFSSTPGYAAVANLGFGHAASGTNGIGGATSAGLLAYSSNAPIEITFFASTNLTVPGITDYFSVRPDNNHTFGTGYYTIEAFDIWGARVASRRIADAPDQLLPIETPGIHKVRIIGSGTTAFDDIIFDPVQPAPVQLRVERDGTRLRIAWPSAFFLFSLEATSDLTPPIFWAPTQAVPQQQGGEATLS